MNYKIFKDRTEAAEELADEIKSYLRSIGISEGTEESKLLIVLAIPRGGVITGDVVASRLRCDMDIIVSRKIGAEYNSELAIGALLPDGSYFINERIANMLNTSQVYIDKQVKIQKKEIERRLIEFRGDKEYGNRLNGKIVVLVDDGIATGSTIIAAARWIKEKHNCKRLIIAVPVAPATNDTIDKLDEIADKVIILSITQEFYAVGQFYENFDQVEDKEVKEIMKKYIKS
ncbi:MAG: phosphoribosyltransferase [Deltaproteobacteria bacterium]|jgi:putative phosphoribosyl transferase|nr:phosphoribosyltransferase family protein [Nitrososphaeraceae archaeon]